MKKKSKGVESTASIKTFDGLGFYKKELPKIEFAGLLTLKQMKIHNAVAHVSLVPRPKIQELNRIYRKINRPTDVLSFAQNVDLPDRKILLGDVILAPAYARKQAKSLMRPFSSELMLLTIHGILHLLGFDHRTKREEKEMFTLQDMILKRALKS